MSVFIYTRNLGTILVNFEESSTLTHARGQKTSRVFIISVFFIGKVKAQPQSYFDVTCGCAIKMTNLHKQSVHQPSEGLSDWHTMADPLGFYLPKPSRQRRCAAASIRVAVWFCEVRLVLQSSNFFTATFVNVLNPSVPTASVVSDMWQTCYGFLNKTKDSHKS